MITDYANIKQITLLTLPNSTSAHNCWFVITSFAVPILKIIKKYTTNVSRFYFVVSRKKISPLHNTSESRDSLSSKTFVINISLMWFFHVRNECECYVPANCCFRLYRIARITNKWFIDNNHNLIAYQTKGK